MFCDIESYKLFEVRLCTNQRTIDTFSTELEEEMKWQEGQKKKVMDLREQLQLSEEQLEKVKKKLEAFLAKLGCVETTASSTCNRSRRLLQEQ
jgi:hypothetical protein